MATSQQPSEQEWSIADKAWGYRFGCDGTLALQKAAEHIGMTRQTVRNLINAGKLRSGHPEHPDEGLNPYEDAKEANHAKKVQGVVSLFRFFSLFRRHDSQFVVTVVRV